MSIARKVALVISWTLAAVSIFMLVKVAKIGPIIATISFERGWGVHSGDFLALIPLALAVGATLLLRQRGEAAV